MNEAREISSRLPALSCPSCGGRTAPGPGGRYDCAYCGGRFLEAEGSGVPTLTPRRHLGAATAYHAAVGWLRAQELTATPTPRPSDVALLFVPYWRFEATLTGWLLTRPHGSRRRPPAPDRNGAGPGWRHGDGDARLAELLSGAGQRGEEARLAAHLAGLPRREPPGEATDPADTQPRTSAILKPVAWSGPACDVREFGLLGVHQFVTPEQLVPFDFAAAERTGAICQVAGSPAAVRRQAERAVVNQFAAKQQILRRRLSFVRERVELIYYPLYLFKYGVRGLACRLVLDGARGTVLAGSRPAPVRDGAWGLLGAVSLWSCVWAASPPAGLGCLPVLWLGDAWRSGGLATPATLALRAQEALDPPRLTVETF